VLEGVRLSAAGLFWAWLAGVMYAIYLLFAKSLRGLHVRSTAVVFTQSACTAAAMLVPGLLAVSAAGYHYSRVDLLMAVLLGLLTTAFSFSLFMDGLHYIRVQHASIMGYLEPVSAPIYALVFLGQRPSLWTIAGGALIVAAGILVVLYARGETEREPLGCAAGRTAAGLPPASGAATLSATPSSWSRTSVWPAARRWWPGPTRRRRSSS